MNYYDIIWFFYIIGNKIQVSVVIFSLLRCIARYTGQPCTASIKEQCSCFPTGFRCSATVSTIRLSQLLSGLLHVFLFLQLVFPSQTSSKCDYSTDLRQQPFQNHTKMLISTFLCLKFRSLCIYSMFFEALFKKTAFS